MPLFKKLYHYRVLRFLVSGGTGAAINLALLYFFTSVVGLHYLISATLAVSLSFIAGFLMQKFWTFRDVSRDAVHRQASTYIAVAAINIFINNIILAVLVEHFGLYYLLAQVCASLIVALWSFFQYRWVFRPRPAKSADLLVVTQKVDESDPVLGFFHTWLIEFARNFSKINVICLEEHKRHLPENVKVYSLGKERANLKLQRLFNLKKLAWKLHDEYKTVFVHMNEEYVVILGWWWRMSGKKVYLWRNHAKGTWKTSVAALFSNKVFYTSPDAYVARYRKSVQMPVGVDTEFFRPDGHKERVPNSVLFLGRISPVKKVLEFIKWIEESSYEATLAGPILPADKEYGEEVLHRASESGKIKYVGPANREEARRLFQTHEIYANFTPPGSFDKTIFEAAACGAKVITHNPEAEEALKEDQSLLRLVQRLKEEMA